MDCSRCKRDRGPGCRRQVGGVAFPELLVTAGLFSIVAVLSLLFLTYNIRMVRRVDSSMEASRNLQMAQQELQRDLLGARREDVVVSDVPDQVGGGGKTGQALLFRSAIDPDTGAFCQKRDGTPLWQKTILYYTAVPEEHDRLFGQACQGGSNPEGYDDVCPHKLLLRKVIDLPPETTPTSSEASAEPLLLDPTAYLTQPVSLSLREMSSEQGSVEARIVASGLLGFRASKGDHQEVEIDLRALMIAEALKTVPVGTASLWESPLVLQRRFTVVPRN